MPTVSKGVFKWLFRQSATLEDFADRLNHFWTFGMLLLFSAIISWRHTYTSPITCWAPAQFTYEFSSYTKDICWNSYFIVYPDDERQAMDEIETMFNITYSDSYPSYETIKHVSNIPSVKRNPVTEDSSLLTKMVTKRTLYQWVPLILCLQALLFKLPNLLMYILHNMSGISFDKIAGLTDGYENLSLQERSVLSRQVGRYIYKWCQQCENCLPWRQLTLLWLVIKVLYCVNIITQLSLVDGILAPENTTSYGDVIIGNLFTNNATIWEEAAAFPKKIFCDFNIIQLQNVQTWTIQCNLSANYFSQFAYMFIWVWLLFVAVVTCCSLLIWCFKTMIPIFRKRYITTALSLNEDVDMSTLSPYNFAKFCDLIGEDGVMALKLVGSNSSDLMVSEILRNMWQTRSEGLVQGPGGGQIMAPSTVHVEPTAPSTMYPLLQASSFQGEKKME